MAENSTGDNRATLAPAPAVPPAAAAAGSYFVQVASFSSKARADELARRIGAKTVASADGKLFRVRYGPYPDANAAQQGLRWRVAKAIRGYRFSRTPVADTDGPVKGLRPCNTHTMDTA